jgi:hypothetical protein
MSKQRPSIVAVQFVGLSLPTFEAQLVELEQVVGGKPFMHLERKGNRWLLLHTDGMFGPEFPHHLELVIERPADDRFLRNADTGQLYEVKGYTVVKVKAPLFHIDQIEIAGRYGSYRITHSDGLMESVTPVHSIVIDRL